MVPFESFYMVSYSHSIVTIVTVSCIISEIKRHIGRNSRFVNTDLYSTPHLGGLSQNIAVIFGMDNKTRTV